MDSNSYADDFEPADFSLSNPRIIPDPYPAYEILRQRDPIHNSRMYGGSWVFFAYEDVVTMLTDDRLTNNRSNLPLLALAPEQREEFADLVPVLSNWVAFFDGDAHLLRRQHMNRICNLFSKESLTPIIDRAVDELLSTWGERADLIADFSRPLPAMVITQLLGAPVTDHELLARWSDDIAYLFGASALTVDDLRRGRSAVQQFAGYLGELVSHSVRFGHDTMLAKLAVEESGGFHFDEAAACAQGMLLMFAGLEPTRYLIGSGVGASAPSPAAAETAERSCPVVERRRGVPPLRHPGSIRRTGRGPFLHLSRQSDRGRASRAAACRVGQPRSGGLPRPR